MKGNARLNLAYVAGMLLLSSPSSLSHHVHFCSYSLSLLPVVVVYQ